MSERPEPPRREDYLRHMLEAAEKVARYTGDLEKSAFLADEKTRDAVIRNLEIVGEAARRIVEEYPEFAQRHPEPELERQARTILEQDSSRGRPSEPQ